MYPDNLQGWFDIGDGLLIFLIWGVFWRSETGQIRVSRNFIKNIFSVVWWVINAS